MDMLCKNCHLELTSENDYCSQCGAKVIRNRLTLRNLWVEFSEKVFNIENTFFKTFFTLFKNPSDVIGGYIDGRRKRYIDVFSYYALAITLAGIQLFVVRKFFPETMDLKVFMAGASPSPPPDTNVDWIYDYYSILALLNLPLYALFGKVVFVRFKKFNYTEHLVIFTYIIAQYSITNFSILITSAAFGVNFYLMGNILNVFLVLYTAYVYKRLYPLTTKQIILRTLLFFGILLGLLMIFILIQLVYYYLNGDLERIMEAEKLKRGVSYMTSSFRNWTS
jgi:Protein of unknown function (DUF3667)